MIIVIIYVFAIGTNMNRMTFLYAVASNKFFISELIEKMPFYKARRWTDLKWNRTLLHLDVTFLNRK